MGCLLISIIYLYLHKLCIQGPVWNGWYLHGANHLLWVI